MKKLNVLLMCASIHLSAIAQDSYWSLVGNNIFNTATQAVNPTAQALSPFGGYSYTSLGGITLVFKIV